MDPHYAESRKIDPARRQPDLARSAPLALRPDGTPDDDDRVEIGPTRLAYAEWEAAGLPCPDLARMRAFRLDRLARTIAAHECDALLMTDPMNIRYASDSTNMQLWNAHNPFRACLVTADGWMIVWDYGRLADLLTAHNPLIRETRGGASHFYFASGDGAAADAARFAAEIADVMTERCGTGRRLAVDKIMIAGLRALEAQGIEVRDGEEITEKARAIKGPDEIAAMRCAVHACEQAMREMEAEMAPGMSEDEIWARLHHGNIRRGGEWIETRLLASGPRTNPWFQECGPRIVQDGDLVAFDTDLIGCYGMCVDISRTWLAGDGDPTAEQRRLYREAHAQIVENMAPLKPGMSFEEVALSGRPVPEEFFALRYGAKMHGVGLCDEWPHLDYAEDWKPGRFDYALEPGMMLCVESYVGAVGGREGVKLEDQVLITEDGVENLTSYPFDARLLG